MLRRLISRRRVFAQASRNHRAKNAMRYSRAHRQMLMRKIFNARSSKRNCAANHFVQNNAKRIYVAAYVLRSSTPLFGCHIGRRARYLARYSLPVTEVRKVFLSGFGMRLHCTSDTKIRNAKNTRGTNQEVLGFNIPVCNQALRCGIYHPITKICRPRRNCVWSKWGAPKVISQ
jgi:hypothetical protein